MSIEPVILTEGGLDLISSRQNAAPGVLFDCENFERSNRVGYQKIQGIRSYCGQSIHDVIDPLVLWQYNRVSLAEIYGNLAWGDPLTGPIKWGVGGSFDSRSGTIYSYDGRGIISYSHPLPTPASGDFTATIIGLEGRIFRPGDDIFDIFNLSLTNEITNDQNYSAIGRVSEVFNSFIPGIGAITNTYGMLEKIGGSFDKVFSGYTYASGRKPGGICVPASMYGYVCGGFYWDDKLHVIADVEVWNFTDWNGDINVGDTLTVYVSGLHGDPSYTFQQAVVEDIVVTSGSVETGDAAGRIYLTALLTSSRNGLFSVKTPTMTRNHSTGVSNPITLTTRAVSDRAAMWREADKFATNQLGWERCDLGYEVQFNYGENLFKVINKLNRNDSLLVSPTPFPSVSTWASANTADGPSWTNANNILTFDTSEAIGTSSNGGTVIPSIEIRDFSTAFASIPDNAVIVGIEVRITRRRVFTGSSPARDDYIAVMDSEVTLVGVGEIPQNKAKADFWPSILTSETYGSPSDTWGCSLSARVIKSANFGIKVSPRFRNFVVTSTPGSYDGHAPHIDAVEMRVHYKDPTSKVVFCTPTTPSQSVASITRTGSTATLTKSSHGYVNGQIITVSGASQAEYNGAFPITNVTTNTFDYTVTGTPVTPATGTITCQLIGEDVCEAKVVWYHKAKGEWGGSPKAEGVLTLTELTNAPAIQTGMQIRSDNNGAGILYALTSSGANKTYMVPSSVLSANDSQYSFVIHNFYGNQDAEQVFGVSGGDFGFSWDGRYLIKLRTGLDYNLDKPRHIARHIDQLALGYYSGGVTLSDQGYPESFAGRVGGASPPSEDAVLFPAFIPSATNSATGDSVYGLAESSNRTLIIGCRRSIRSIIGGGSSIAQEVITSESGIIEYTMRLLNGQIMFINHRGVQTLQSVLTNESISEYVAPFIVPRIQSTNGAYGQVSGIECVGVVRSKNQYRVYFRDRKILTVTLTREGVACTTQRLPFVPKWVSNGLTTGGKDVVFCGTYAPGSVSHENDLLRAAYHTDISSQVPTNATHALVGPNIFSGNYVYQMEVGSTWDDLLPINASMTINVGHLGAEVIRKRFDRMLISGQCYGFCNFGVKYVVDYGSVESSVLNVNAGDASGNPLNAFNETVFSRETPINRDGYALAVQIVSDGSNRYGDSTLSSFTAPYYIRPFSIQSLTIITGQLNTRRA